MSVLGKLMRLGTLFSGTKVSSPGKRIHLLISEKDILKITTTALPLEMPLSRSSRLAGNLIYIENVTCA